MAEVYTKEGLRLSGCTMYISADEKAVMKELVEAFPGKVTLGPVSCFVDNWERDADDIIEWLQKRFCGYRYYNRTLSIDALTVRFP